jgi:hypothetical protein
MPHSNVMRRDPARAATPAGFASTPRPPAFTVNDASAPDERH